MREVMEHFGMGFLELIGGIGIINIMIIFFSNNGIIKETVLNYFSGLCG